MSGAQELLDVCASRGLRVCAQGGGLEFEPTSAMTRELAERLREHKQELLVLLAPQGTQTRDSAPPPRSDRPESGCWVCGCREFARSLAGTGWVCTNCHPPGELRAHVERCIASGSSRSTWGAALEARRVERREVQAKLAAAAAKVRAELLAEKAEQAQDEQLGQADLAAFMASRRGDAT